MAFAVAVCLPLSSLAEPVVSATVNRERVPIGEQIVLSIRVTDIDPPKVVAPRIENLLDAEVRGPMGPTTSRHIQMGAGGASQTSTTDYSYLIVPKRPGVFHIPPLQVRVDGRVFRTDAISVTVVESPDESFFSNPIDLTVRISEDTAYVGQAVVVEYCFLEQSGSRVTNRQIVSEPSFTGALVDKVFDARTSQGASTERIINGVRYSEIPILTVVLFPTTTGDLVIPEMGMSASVSSSTGRRDFWGETVFRPRSISVHSGRSTVHVKPLPPGAPTGFDGAIGSFSLSSTVDLTEVRKGDPVTWKVTLIGKGNLKSAGRLTIPPLNSFRTYDPDVELKTTHENGSYGGTLTYERVLLPLHAGYLDVPPVSFVYFDPSQGRYRTASSSRHRLAVTTEDLSGPVTQFGLTQSQIQQFGDDIRFIHPDSEALGDDSTTLFQSWKYWLLNALAGFVLVCASVVHVRRRLENDPQSARFRFARREAARHMREARTQVKKEDYGNAVISAQRALAHIVCSRENIRAASLTPADARERLLSQNVPPEITERTVSVLAAADRMRYAPGNLDEAQVRRLCDAMEKQISELTTFLRA